MLDQRHFRQNHEEVDGPLPMADNCEDCDADGAVDSLFVIETQIQEVERFGIEVDPPLIHWACENSSSPDHQIPLHMATSTLGLLQVPFPEADVVHPCPWGRAAGYTTFGLSDPRHTIQAARTSYPSLVP